MPIKIDVLPNGRLVLPDTLATRDRALDEAGALFRSLLTDDACVADEVIAERRTESRSD